MDNLIINDSVKKSKIVVYNTTTKNNELNPTFCFCSPQPGKIFFEIDSLSAEQLINFLQPIIEKSKNIFENTLTETYKKLI